MTRPGFAAAPRLVYIATRYADAEHVHTVVRPAILAAGLGVTSTWHAPPWAPEDLGAMDAAEVVRVYLANRAEMAAADTVLAIAADGGRETYAEVEAAYASGLRVIWLGRPHLSAAARAVMGHVELVATLEDAVRAMTPRACCAISDTEPPEPMSAHADPLEALLRIVVRNCVGGT